MPPKSNRTCADCGIPLQHRKRGVHRCRACASRELSERRKKELAGVPGPNPSGLCMCGCGQTTSLAKQSSTETGNVRDKPIRYIVGHRILPPKTIIKADIDKFWSLVDRSGSDDSCWEWLGHTNRLGYGRFSRATRFGKTRQAHRLAYEFSGNTISQGLVLDHLCRNPSCVNPRHLEAVTQRENTRRGNAPNIILYRKNTCRKGHEMTTENTGWINRTSRPPERQCLTCRRRYEEMRKSRRNHLAHLSRIRNSDENQNDT